MTTANVLLLQGLTRRFQEGDRLRTVLDGVDLAVRAGEAVTLLGRSGGGKSTLLNLIAGIDYPDAGEVVINGQNITRMSERARTLFRRRHIGFIYQFFNLIPTLTVEENLLLPLQLNGRTGAPALAAARTLLAEVGLAGRRGAFPDRLSAGEQQRVAVARALVHEPLLVLADEPTGNLDAETGRSILALIQRLVRATGKTLILVTHSQEVSRLGDRVLVLDHGRVSTAPAEIAW